MIIEVIPEILKAFCVFEILSAIVKVS
jgi:hypothetical protein